jgi:hypothetical protein
LKSLLLSDNDKLAGSLPPCWLASKSLQELQLAGLSSLAGPLPQLASTAPVPGRGLRQSANPLSGICGFGLLKYINFAGIIGDNEQGFTGTASWLEVMHHANQQQHHLVLSLQALLLLQVTSLDTPAAAVADHVSPMALKSNDALPLLMHLVTLLCRCKPAGTLPISLGFCQDLLYLDLSGHALSGPLPALPPNMQFLNLSSNLLSQTLPEFAQAAQLQYLDLSFNK